MTNITVNDFHCLIESGVADVTIILKYLRETYDATYFSTIHDLDDIQGIMDKDHDIIQEFYACLASDYSNSIENKAYKK